MARWSNNAATGCSFGSEPVEDRVHIFFECLYTRKIWETLVRGLMGSDFSTKWDEILDLVIHSPGALTKAFILRYTFQAAIHAIWCKRNFRRHGEAPTPEILLSKKIDIVIRNRLSIIRGDGRRKYEDGLQLWFATRAP
ncbi:uncharacterized protein LOC112087524 [Eutrema salsugineum]|uniref:uncharacterized protein LOC112087524 n=1 Tax=Eutrema salsugineum TaxID=72664 RepID=UPI000CED2D80|nr:uncharacterized protein LOC112087524 [Eutrema salsugineum]